MRAILTVGIVSAVLMLVAVPFVAVRAAPPMVWGLGILAFPGGTPYSTPQRAAISAAIDRIALSRSAAELVGSRAQATPAYSFLYGQGKQSDLVAGAPASTMNDFPILVVLRGTDDKLLATLIINQLTSAGVPSSAQAVGGFDEAMKLLHSAGGKAYLTSFGPNEAVAVDPILLLGNLAGVLLPNLKANTERTDALAALLTDRVFAAVASDADRGKQAVELSNLLIEDAHIIPLFWLVPR